MKPKRFSTRQTGEIMKNFVDLVNDLRQEDNLNKLGPELALMVPNRWDYLVNWAKKKGYEFTPEDIKHYFSSIHPKAYVASSSQGGGKQLSNIHGKWNLNTLP
jgi:hypothetical protein